MAHGTLLRNAVMMPAASMSHLEQRRVAAGSSFALAAFLWWGVAPVYFKAIAHVPALEVLAHRVAWSAALLLAALAARGRLGVVRDALRSTRTLALLVASAALIAFNWLVFIWAIQNGRLLECSLGYFINPLASIALGVAVLGEKLSRTRKAALALAAVSVLWLALAAGRPPWIPLALAASFAFYGLLRKVARVEAMEGLFVETLLVLPAAAAWLVHLARADSMAFGSVDLRTDLLLAAAGVVTAVPLLCFTAAARRLTLTAVGFFQYLAPTCQALLAVLAFGEPLTRERLVAFAGTWTALALVSAEALRAKAR